MKYATRRFMVQYDFMPQNLTFASGLSVTFLSSCIKRYIVSYHLNNTTIYAYIYIYIYDIIPRNTGPAGTLYTLISACA